MNCKNSPLAEQGMYVGCEVVAVAEGAWGWPPQLVKEFSRDPCQPGAGKDPRSPGKPKMSEEQQKLEQDEA